MKQCFNKVVIVVGLFAVVFASDSRVNSLGGAKFWADDYANMGLFPGSVNDHNLAWTNGTDFNANWNVDGTTWGFSGTSNADDVVNMRWGNGSIGVNFGLNMVGEDEDAGTDAETNFDIGVGTTMGLGDVGFTYDGDDIGLNLRRAQNLWMFENMVVSVKMVGKDEDAGTDGSMGLDADFYRMSGGDNANALFAMGFAYSDVEDGSLSMNYTWALESSFDWATLRLGYTKGYDLMNSVGTAGALTAGLGFNYGNWQADLSLYDGALNGIMTNPIHFLNGRNEMPLAAGFNLSYVW